MQVPAEKPADDEAHGVPQSAGLFTVMLLLHPAPRVAVMVTAVPIVMPVTVLPDMVPADAVTVAPAVAENATL